MGDCRTVFEELLECWDGEQVVIRHDADSGAWMFVCIHSTTLGPAAGGTRMRVYGSPSDALADGQRLASGMTRKFAVSGVAFGGGKAVLAVPEIPTGDARRRLLHRYGDLVSSLGGTFRTAADMNTRAADMDVIAERCPYVFGRTEEHGGSGDSGRGTARGVFHGIRATLGHTTGSDELANRSILVQGVGSVGRVLAELVAAEEAEVLVSDVDAEAASAVAASLGARIVAPDAVPDTECDVYAPCAVGGTLNAATIARLRCRAVAGSANNQLAEPEDAQRLHERGIVYAPDFVINAGGVLQIVGLELLGWDHDRLERAYAKIGTSLAEIFARAEEDGVNTGEAAERVAAERLAAGPDALEL